MSETAEAEKRLKAIKKKLVQIEKLKEKAASELDAEAKEKVASEPGLRQEAYDLEVQIKTGVFPDKASAEDKEAPSPRKAAPQASAAPPERTAAAPQASAADVADVEKRVKALRKKLVQISKLKEKDPADLDVDAREKVASETALIAEVCDLEDQIRTGNIKMVAKAPEPAPAPSPAPAPEPPAPKAKKAAKEKKAPEPVVEAAPAKEVVKKEKFPKAEPKEEYKPPPRKTEPVAANAVESDEEEEVKVSRKDFESSDLKTNRQKIAPAANTKASLHEVNVSSKAAVWAEVKEVIESGDHGTDKGRQKKAIVVEQTVAESPYDVFDTALLRCSFLTRVELRLAPGVLSQDAFQLGFPGSLCDNLVELILKGNKMAAIPEGVKSLKRIRSMDFSHNLVEALPPASTWESITGSLELLDLSFNKLSSISSLAPLTKLSNLKLDGNQVTSLDGISWSSLKQFVTLTAVGNQIKEIPEEIAEVGDSMMHLDLSENSIVVCPLEITELKKLKSLSLAGNPIKDQKVVNNLAKGSNGIKDLKAYLTKIGTKGKKK